MTETQFIEAVRALRGFPPDIAHAAEEASAAMTPLRRANVLETLTQLHTRYGEIEQERIALTDEALAELRQMKTEMKTDLQTQSAKADTEQVEELSQQIDAQNA